MRRERPLVGRKKLRGTHVAEAGIVPFSPSGPLPRSRRAFLARFKICGDGPKSMRREKQVMRRIVKVLMTVAALMPLGSAVADESLMEYLQGACEADLKQYCSTVTPGEGRLLHCVAAHEDKLSGQCSYALYRASSLLEQFAAAIAYVATECEADIQKHCPAVEAGEGRIVSCLQANQGQLQGGCKKALSDTVGD